MACHSASLDHSRPTLLVQSLEHPPNKALSKTLPWGLFILMLNLILSCGFYCVYHRAFYSNIWPSQAAFVANAGNSTLLNPLWLNCLHLKPIFIQNLAVLF